jgi:hypothetical protein
MKSESPFLRRPPLETPAAALVAFEELFNRFQLENAGNLIDYTLPYPKWQF